MAMQVVTKSAFKNRYTASRTRVLQASSKGTDIVKCYHPLLWCCKDIYATWLAVGGFPGLHRCYRFGRVLLVALVVAALA
jgi:hypothetical protein